MKLNTEGCGRMIKELPVNTGGGEECRPCNIIKRNFR